MSVAPRCLVGPAVSGCAGAASAAGASAGRTKAGTVGRMRRVRAGVVALAAVAALLLGGVAAVFSAGVAAAQQQGDGPTISPVAQPEAELDGPEGIDFDENQAGIDRARRTLIAIAALMTVLLVAYWWHTIPSRRLRIATERLADHRARTETGDRAAAPTDRG